jgi:hypothetical protein
MKIMIYLVNLVKNSILSKAVINNLVEKFIDNHPDVPMHELPYHLNLFSRFQDLPQLQSIEPGNRGP